MKWFILSVCVGLCLGETAFNGYAPSGWRPQGAQFKLPTEYGPPSQENLHASEIEITRENIQYAGQLGETTTEADLYSTYLPPDDATTTEIPENQTDDTLTVQALPKKTPAQFRNGLNIGEIPANNANYRVQSQQFSGKFQQRKPSEFAEFVPQQVISFSRLQQPASQYRAPVNNQFRAKQIAQPGQYIPPAPPKQPTTQYGPPPQEEQPTEEPESEIVHSSEEDHDDYDDEHEPTIAISNAQNGQYYILAPDNTLQKVVFMTSQTEDDRRKKGFTAQLRYKTFYTNLINLIIKENYFYHRYTPVEPIRDPIYSYNEQGQLVRIYNKKK